MVVHTCVCCHCQRQQACQHDLWTVKQSLPNTGLWYLALRRTSASLAYGSQQKPTSPTLHNQKQY
jgi:hypothetical protein